MKPSLLLHTLGAEAGLLPTQCLSPKLNISQLSSAIHHANPQAELGFGSLGSCLVGKEWGPFSYECVARGVPLRAEVSGRLTVDKDSKDLCVEGYFQTRVFSVQGGKDGCGVWDVSFHQ